MKKIAIGILWTVTNGMCQTPAKDPDAVQSLLVEVHQLRQDLEAMTAASQRVQIAVYGMFMQDAAVARAEQRSDLARDRRKSAELSRDRMAAEVQRMDSELASGTMNDADAKAGQQRLTQLKNELDRSTAELQTWQATEAETSAQLRTEQAKLIEIQDRIERLDKTLEKIGKP
jgi:hypothetical protein